MKTFREVFPKHAFLPVLHLKDSTQGWEEFTKAMENGANGVFFINHAGMGAEEMTDFAGEVKEKHLGVWMGANWLGYPTHRMFYEAQKAGIDGVWTDSAHVDEYLEVDQQHEAKEVLSHKETAGWKGSYFGGVGFKTNRPARDLSRVARLTVPYSDVICTSGPGTGRAAEVEKIKTIRAAIGPNVPLAIASGVTPENVKGYLPYANAFLVGTGIEQSWGVLDVKKVRALAKVLKEF